MLPVTNYGKSKTVLTIFPTLRSFQLCSFAQYRQYTTEQPRNESKEHEQWIIVVRETLCIISLLQKLHLTFGFFK